MVSHKLCSNMINVIQLDYLKLDKIILYLSVIYEIR